MKIRSPVFFETFGDWCIGAPMEKAMVAARRSHAFSPENTGLLESRETGTEDFEGLQSLDVLTYQNLADFSEFVFKRIGKMPGAAEAAAGMMAVALSDRQCLEWLVTNIHAELSVKEEFLGSEDSLAEALAVLARRGDRRFEDLVEDPALRFVFNTVSSERPLSEGLVAASVRGFVEKAPHFFLKKIIYQIDRPEIFRETAKKFLHLVAAILPGQAQAVMIGSNRDYTIFARREWVEKNTQPLTLEKSREKGPNRLIVGLLDVNDDNVCRLRINRKTKSHPLSNKGLAAAGRA